VPPSTEPSGALPSSDTSTSPAGLPTGPSGSVIQYLADVDQVVRGYNTGTRRSTRRSTPQLVRAQLSVRLRYGQRPVRSEPGVDHVPRVIGVDDDSDPSVVLQFEIFADGKRVGKTIRMHLGQHQAISVNIAGALRLKLVISRVSGDGQAHGVWGDAEVDK